MNSFLLPELRAFLRYTDLPGEAPVNVYLAGLILASQPSYLSIVTGHPGLATSRSILVDLLGAGFSDAPGEGKVSSRIAAMPEAEFAAHGYQTIIDSFQKMGLEGNETMAMMAGMMRTAEPFALHRSAAHLVKGTRPSVREKLYQLSIPRTYIFGRRSLPDPDWTVLPEKGIEVQSVDEAGHGMAWDNPQGLAEALDKALGFNGRQK